MALQCGIVGLPNVGKSTLFNCLSNAKAQSANFPFCTIEPNVGVISVPYSGKNYQLMLVADEQTLGSPTIEARIVYNTMGAQTLFDRRVYASFDVSALWSRATCRRLSIGIADRTFVFEKN